MPSTSEKNRLKSNKSGKNYSVELHVGNRDITKYLSNVRIINSIHNMWPSISLRVAIDSNDIVLEDIYGQKPLVLRISLNGEDGNTIEVNDFYLLYLQSNVNLQPKTRESSNQWDLQIVEFSTVPLYSMNLLSMFINEIYQIEDGEKNGVQIIKEILDNYGFSYEIDGKGFVSTNTPQTIIPPMSFKQMIDYIDFYIGIYNGPIFYSCSHQGIFKMWDLSQRAKKKSNFKVYQLPTGAADPQEISNIFNKSLANDVYYTREAVQTIYHSNANLLKYGYDFLSITHPDSSLYDLKYKNAKDITKNFGVANEGKDFIFNPLLKCRKKYSYSTSGTRGEDVVTSTPSYNLSKISTLQLTLLRNIKIKKILEVGEPVTFEPMTLEYMRYRGKYILESIDFQLSAEDSENWDSICQMRMFRTIQQQ